MHCLRVLRSVQNVRGRADRVARVLHFSFKVTESNLDSIECTTGSCTTATCCRLRACSDNGAPSCSAGTFMKTSNTCADPTGCTSAECCETNPNCASATGAVCTTPGKMLLTGDRSATVCSGDVC